MGANVLDLRNAGMAATPQVRTVIESALTRVGRHLRQRLERPDMAPAPQLQASLDRAIAGLIESEPGFRRVQGLTAATGLRLGLFPPSPAAAAAHGAAP
jgi:hypothetical protein